MHKRSYYVAKEGMHFISVDEDLLQEAGLIAAKRIVPCWFGLEAELETVSDIMDDTVKIDVTGRSQFKLFVNGEAVLFGPLRGSRTTAYYDTVDIAPYLKKGTNHLVMQVLSYPEHPMTQEDCGPMNVYGDNNGPGIAVGGRLGDVDLSEAKNWHVYLDPSMSFNAEEMFYVGSYEDVDGRIKADNPFLKETWDLTGLPEAVDSEGVDFVPYGERWGKTLTPRPIAPLYRKERAFLDWTPQTIPAGETRSWVINAGELTTGFFRIGFAGGWGSKVTMTYAESYYHKDENGKEYKGVRDDASGYIKGVHDIYIVGGQEGEVFEPFRLRCFRFIELTVEAAEEVTILPMTYIETAYPLINRERPTFEDPKKEKLYDIALRTLQLCMHDTYEDCPYYEQLMYLGDSRLEMLFTYACAKDYEFPAHCIDLFAASLLEDGYLQSRFPSRELQVIPMFSLYFLLMLEDYGNETGDWTRMAKHLPTAEVIVEKFLSKKCPDGTIAPQGHWDYFDWTSAWDRQTATPTAALDGESALQNLFFVYCVQALIRILPHYHRESLAAYYQHEIDHIGRTILETCYVPDKGLIKEGPKTEEYSQHTQVYAVLTGLIRGEQAKALMDKVLTDESLIQCSFVQKFYIFRALEKVDMYDRSEVLWQDWERFIELHASTFPETPYDPRSDCHAWSSLPLYEFRKARS